MFPPILEYEISPANLHSLLNENREIRLIDCREEDEYEICRIEGAALFPLSRFAEEAPSRLVKVESAHPMVVYCHHGMRSLQATQFLRAKGLTDVWSLRGGIDLWSREIDQSVPRY